MVYPNFLIIGASKAATTSLWHILRQHPEIYMPEKKEVNFFVRKDWEQHTDSYLSHFRERAGEKAVGEASPLYSETHIAPWVPGNIHAYNPEMKLIYSVRHPYDRMKSVWKQTLYSGHWKKEVYRENYFLDVPRMPLDFDKAIREYPPFIGASKYWTHISNYLEYFPGEQLHIIYYRDFVKDPRAETRKLLRFLDASDDLQKLNLDVSPQNISEGKTMENPALNEIRKTYAYRVLIKLLPERFRKKYYDKMVRKKVPGNIELTDMQKRTIRNELGTEIRKLHAYTGKPDDFWAL